jgi:hypothetical protein
MKGIAKKAHSEGTKTKRQSHKNTGIAKNNKIRTTARVSRRLTRGYFSN